MKFHLPLSAVVCLGMVACETMNSPITEGGTFDPLRAPGTNQTPSLASGPTFKAGQFVQASLNNTAFFKTRPKGDANADKLLKRGTSMKVISNSSNYVKVELDSGEIGFVPSIMLEDPKMVASSSTLPGEYQVYPPLPSSNVPVEPLPLIDPAGLPPDGAIPTIIDPEAPSSLPPDTSATTAPTTPSAPASAPDAPVTPPASDLATPVPLVEPKIEESVPLPPNGEE